MHRFLSHMYTPHNSKEYTWSSLQEVHNRRVLVKSIDVPKFAPNDEEHPQYL